MVKPLVLFLIAYSLSATLCYRQVDEEVGYELTGVPVDLQVRE